MVLRAYLWLQRRVDELGSEKGAQTIVEVVALAAVIVTLLAAMASVFKVGGKTVGQAIIDALVRIITTLWRM